MTSDLDQGVDHGVEQGASGFAIVGYAARFPGAADADEFWEMLRQGRDAISEIPGDRWNMDDFYDPDPDTPGKIVTRRAGLIDDVGRFDAPFFGVSTREAVFMDPPTLRGRPGRAQSCQARS